MFLRRYIWWKFYDGDWVGYVVGDVVVDVIYKCFVKWCLNGVD